MKQISVNHTKIVDKGLELNDSHKFSNPQKAVEHSAGEGEKPYLGAIT